MEHIQTPTPTGGVRPLRPQAVALLDPSTGDPIGSADNPLRVAVTSQPATNPLTDAQLRAAALPVSGPLTDAQLRATDVPVKVSPRVCLGTQFVAALSASNAISLTVPNGAVTAEIQADGGTVRMRRDATAPTATQGWRIDDGLSVVVDSVLSSVRLLAQSGTTTNVQITYFDRV